MAEQLPSVPEENATGFTDAIPPPNSYRESIRSVGVAWPGWRIGSSLSAQSGQSGSNYSSNSGASSSYMSSNYSVCSSGSPFADLGASDLTKIAQRMVSDGYTQRVFQAFINASSSPLVGNCGACSLENWFAELDVHWVLQIRNKYELRQQLQLQEAPGSWLQELVERWIRALSIIVHSIKELVSVVGDTPGLARFGNSSISLMLAFVDAIVQVDRGKNLHVILHMYLQVCIASHDILMLHVISSDAQRIFNQIGLMVEREGNKLITSISDTLVQVRQALMKSDNLWATEIPQGRGEVHSKIQLLVGCVVSMRSAQASTENCAPSNNTEKLRDLIHDTINYLKDLLLKESELYSDPRLRYLFLLNNSYFIAQMLEPSVLLDIELQFGHHRGLKLTPECEKYMDRYVDLSWGHVLSCIPAIQRHRLFNTSSHNSLDKFKYRFSEAYQAQKFWKVPDPQLRDALRKTIAERVISGYRNYLKEHPELEKYAAGKYYQKSYFSPPQVLEESSPEGLEEMLGELFEG